MFVIAGTSLIEMVTKCIPAGIERVMQKRHTKWCDHAKVVPWTAGDVVGGTIRISMGRSLPDYYSISWGAEFDERSNVDMFLYEGDVAEVIFRAAMEDDVDGGMRQDLRRIFERRVRCGKATDLVSRVIQMIQ